MDKTDPPPTPYLDNPLAPEAFADLCRGIYFQNGNVHFTFAAMRSNHADPVPQVAAVCVGRLVMPVPAVREMVTFLQGFLAQFDQAPPPPAPIPSRFN